MCSFRYISLLIQELKCLSFSFVSGKTSEVLFIADCCASEVNSLLELVALTVHLEMCSHLLRPAAAHPRCGGYPGFGRLDLP